MIAKILFPVDFSSSCVDIRHYVKRAATMFAAEVTLLHVCSLESHNGFELYMRSLQEIAAEHWEVGRRRLDSFLVADFPAAECPRVLRSGDAAEQIAEVANTRGFDVIIMPTHAGRFHQMLLGSTTAKVLNQVECPVLTTEHAQNIMPRSLEHRQWVCAIRTGADSERVLRSAKEAAEQVGADLSVIDANYEGDSHSIQPLLDAARESGADALIIGRTARSGAVRHTWDLTYRLIRDSPCPVLSV